MAENSKIQWTDHTFNPWISCSKVNAGCTNCYAEADMDKRRGRVKWGPNGTRSRTSDDYWRQPLRWNRDWNKRRACCACGLAVTRAVYPVSIYPSGRIKHQTVVWACPRHGELDKSETALMVDESITDRPHVFCASLADVFEKWDGPIVDHRGRILVHANGRFEPEITEQHESCSRVMMDDLRADLFRLIDATPNLDWLVLTKRPENIRRMWPDYIALKDDDPDPVFDDDGRHMKPRKNIWLGASVSDQETADRMLPELLKCRDLTPVLFVSYEPALGPVDWEVVPGALPEGSEACNYGESHRKRECDCHFGLDWIIAGGESGPNARPCSLGWIESTIDQCRAAGVACFVKQLGSVAVTDNVNLHDFHPAQEFDSESYGRGAASGARVLFRDKKGGDPSEWPEEFRVRELPIARHRRN